MSSTNKPQKISKERDSDACQILFQKISNHWRNSQMTDIWRGEHLHNMEPRLRNSNLEFYKYPHPDNCSYFKANLHKLQRENLNDNQDMMGQKIVGAKSTYEKYISTWGDVFIEKDNRFGDNEFLLFFY
jgi:hypothetical protein